MLHLPEFFTVISLDFARRFLCPFDFRQRAFQSLYFINSNSVNKSNPVFQNISALVLITWDALPMAIILVKPE
jgi:hypothetical protein